MQNKRADKLPEKWLPSSGPNSAMIRISSPAYDVESLCERGRL
jgi:hypothetical protein